MRRTESANSTKIELLVKSDSPRDNIHRTMSEQIDLQHLSYEANLELSRVHGEMPQILGSLKSWDPFAFYWHANRGQQLLQRIGALSERLENDFNDFCVLIEKLVPRIERPPGVHVSNVENGVEWRKMNAIRELLIADLESLYETSSNFLDQWAFLACAIAGIGKRNYHKLIISYIESEQMHGGLWSKLQEVAKADLIWIHEHIKIFRDNFVVHHEKPWQQSTLHNCETKTLHLSFLIAPGWYGEKERNSDDQSIMQLHGEMPSTLRIEDAERAGTNFVLSHMMEYIDEFESDSRKRLIDIAKRIGFVSPPYSVVAQNVLELPMKTVSVLLEHARAHPEAIDLGKRPQADN